jgi:hypothetical protein
MRKQQLKAFIKSARASAALTRADFDGLGSRPDDVITLKESEVTDFIRERTRLYRETWIINYLDEALRIIDGEQVGWTPRVD